MPTPKSKTHLPVAWPFKITEKLLNTMFELVSYFDGNKHRRHLMNVRCWLGPLPDADTPSETALLVSDIKAGEFAFV